MQSQSGFDIATEVLKPTNNLSPHRRVLGELSANSRRRTSPSSIKQVYNSFKSPAPSKSPSKHCLKSPILSPIASPKRSAARVIDTFEGAENQASNTIQTSDNNSKKRSIDQVNSSASEQLSRPPVRHAPSVSVSSVEREIETSNDKDAEEPVRLADTTTKTSLSSVTDNDASATTTTNDYKPSVEALVGDEMAVMAKHTATTAAAASESPSNNTVTRITTKAVRKIF